MEKLAGSCDLTGGNDTSGLTIHSVYVTFLVRHRNEWGSWLEAATSLAVTKPHWTHKLDACVSR
jgi:hypothetical protein